MKPSSRELPPPELPTWHWLWSPLAIIATLFLLRLWWDPDLYNKIIRSEAGVVELMSPIIAMVAVVYCARIVLIRQTFEHWWLGTWFLLFGLGCFYYAGEELSWGQQLFHWETPEAIARLNHQGESNLHNITPLFNELPRFLITLFCLIAGVIVPLLFARHWRPDDPSDWRAWFWPTRLAIPSALCAGLFTTPVKILAQFGVGVSEPFTIFARAGDAGEIKELLLAVFMTVYAASAYRRLARVRASTRVAAAETADWVGSNGGGNEAERTSNRTAR
jgi:hypothetical protein